MTLRFHSDNLMARILWLSWKCSMKPANIWLGRGPLPQTKETAKLMINTKAYNAEDIGARTCIYIILLYLKHSGQ